MTQKLDLFSIELQDGQACELQSVVAHDGVTEYTFSLRWTTENAQRNDKFQVSWSMPMTGMMYRWTPSCGLQRNIQPGWGAGFLSMISKSAPLCSLYDGEGINHYTWALSECQKLITVLTGVIEENGCLCCRFIMGTFQFTNRYKTTVTLRIDTRPLPFYEAVSAAAAWWARDLGMTPAEVPAAAREPAYSFWYSYHQNITDREVEAECRRAKALGFQVCIIDDGWQTEDNNRGYAYCGDWEPAPSKFPDMAAHVERVHRIGMKYVLWYSVVFVGYQSKNYERFKDKLLRRIDRLDTAVLDPRYREVREFLLDIYKTALLEWKLDGFKLDFIDTWAEQPGDAPYNEKMDIPSLQDAVQVFMTTVMRELKAIKPEILLEFRQGYIGPLMKTFGNMFRVGDCPYDYLSNRVGVLDLRMLMGCQAVHSDMLMWHPDDDAERDTLQIISVMFGVMQYSARLDSITPRVEKMSKFWLDFLNIHRHTLLDGTLRVYDAHQLYTWAQSVSEEECIVAVYANEKCIHPEPADTLWIANGSGANRVLAELQGQYQMTVFNCCGEEVSSGSVSKGLQILDIPTGGLALLSK